MTEPGETNIQIFKPFEEAFEMMKRILFQPFDLSKWLVIGFAAWLANIGSGGANFQYNRGRDLEHSPEVQKAVDAIHQIPMWILVSGVALIVILFFAVIILFAWLRARGRFMFTDCVVKNQAAIVQPWREFRKEGDSYFLFSLLVSCGLLVILGGLSLPFLLPFIRHATFPHLHDFYLVSMLAFCGVVFMLFAIIWGLIAHVMVVIMYRRRCHAVEGFRAAVSLIFEYPGEIALYCLFWIVLVIGTVVVACILTCATCCLVAFPYVGAVILLPVYVWLRGFGLLFFRQFGPDCDAWAGLRRFLRVRRRCPRRCLLRRKQSAHGRDQQDNDSDQCGQWPPSAELLIGHPKLEKRQVS
jgi:hypothetical protein